MSKCIVCECSRVITYEPPKERPPIKCPDCGRDTRHYTSMKEDDPRVKMLVEKYKTRLGEAFLKGESDGVLDNVSDAPDIASKNAADGNAAETITGMMSSDREHTEARMQYCLVSKDGKIHIGIPGEGGVIGRTAIGGEKLAHNGRISREHVKLIPAKRAQGVMAEDLSANGTFIDGRRLAKNEQEFVVIGSVIKMGGEEFVLENCPNKDAVPETLIGGF